MSNNPLFRIINENELTHNKSQKNNHVDTGKTYLWVVGLWWSLFPFLRFSLFWDGFLINMRMLSSAGSYSWLLAQTGASWPLCKEAVHKVTIGACQSTTCPTVPLGSCAPGSWLRLLGPHMDLVSAALAQGSSQPGLIQNTRTHSMHSLHHNPPPPWHFFWPHFFWDVTCF